MLYEVITIFIGVFRGDDFNKITLKNARCMPAVTLTIQMCQKNREYENHCTGVFKGAEFNGPSLSNIRSQLAVTLTIQMCQKIK